MGSFGDRLRREREQRGITLDDIALNTKIRAGLLQALEEEKFDRLPGGIFNKGFVRAYARHLGLDEDQAVADYLVASGEGPVRRPAEGIAGSRESVEPRIQLVRDEQESESRESGSGVRGLAAGLVVLAVVGTVAWFYYHRERQAEMQSTEAVLATSPSDSGSSSAASSQAKPSSSESAAAVDKQKTAAEAAQAPAQPVTSPAESKAALTTPINSSPASVSGLAPAGSFTVRLRPDEECWLQIAADGKSEEITMESGSEKLITAKNRVTIRAGNVGALSITFNGKALPLQGQYGEVKTMTFGPNGLLPAEPKPAPTSTVNP